MKTLRHTLLGLLIILALTVFPSVAFAQGGGNYSGDDAYDPAARGLFYRPTVRYIANFSGDDSYDLAADGLPSKAPVHYTHRFSGDDAYDPAAGGFFYEPTVRYVTNFSGDDAYDPAFGWTPHVIQIVRSNTHQPVLKK